MYAAHHAGCERPAGWRPAKVAITIGSTPKTKAETRHQDRAEKRKLHASIVAAIRGLARRAQTWRIR